MTKQQTTTIGNPTFWEAADLAKKGYPVFPVGPDKNPSVEGGFYAATTDLSQIAAWIEEGRENDRRRRKTLRGGLLVLPSGDRG
jgi:hypothetical protein